MNVWARLRFQAYRRGWRCFPSAWQPRAAGPVALCYHDVGAASPYTRALGVTLTAAHFARHAAFLAANYNVCPVAALGAGSGPGAAAITVDDGYRSSLTDLLPAAARHGLPVAVYVTAGNVETGFNWQNRLAWLIDRADRATLIRLADGGLTRPAERRGLPPSRDEFWHHFDEQATQAAVAEEFARLHPAPPPRLYLDAQELAQLAAHPLVTIGSHTLTHAPLAGLSPARLAEEVEGGHERLRQLLGPHGDRLEGFAVPFGFEAHLTPAVAAAVARVAPRLLSAYGGKVGDHRRHGLPELRRVGVWGDLGTLWHRLAAA